MAYEGDIVRILQIVRSTTTSANTSITDTIPDDNSIPQITEGTQLLTAAITPISPTSTLKIVYSGSVLVSSEIAIMAFFVQGTADALKAEQIAQNSAASQSNSAYVEYELTSGSTAARTYEVRVGRAGSNTLTMNPTTYGGVNVSEFYVMEYE